MVLLMVLSHIVGRSVLMVCIDGNTLSDLFSWLCLALVGTWWSSSSSSCSHLTSCLRVRSCQSLQQNHAVVTFLYEPSLFAINRPTSRLWNMKPAEQNLLLWPTTRPSSTDDGWTKNHIPTLGSIQFFIFFTTETNCSCFFYFNLLAIVLTALMSASLIFLVFCSRFYTVSVELFVPAASDMEPKAQHVSVATRFHLYELCVC